MIFEEGKKIYIRGVGEPLENLYYFFYWKYLTLLAL